MFIRVIMQSLLFTFALSVAAIYAIQECDFVPESYKMEPCSDTQTFFRIQCHMPTMNENEIKWKCKREVDMDIHSGKVVISGTANSVPFSYNSSEMCEQLEKRLENLDENCPVISLGLLPQRCSDNWNTDGFVENIMDISKVDKQNMKKQQGIVKADFQLIGINGDESKNVCIHIENELKCQS